MKHSEKAGRVVFTGDLLEKPATGFEPTTIQHGPCIHWLVASGLQSILWRSSNWKPCLWGTLVVTGI